MIRLLLSQVEPSQNLSLANLTSIFNQVIEDGDLNKAAQISNTILEAILQDSSLSTEEKTKVIVFKIMFIRIRLKLRNTGTDV